MFNTHKLSEKGFQEVKEIRTTMRIAAEYVLAVLPDGREKAVFKTKLKGDK